MPVNITPAQQLAEYLAQQSISPNDLQKHNTADAAYFERLMEQSSNQAERLGLNNNQAGIDLGEGKATNQIFEMLSSLDGDYRQTVERLQNWPSFDHYLEREGVNGRHGSSDNIDQIKGHRSNIDTMSLVETSESSKEGSLDTGITELDRIQKQQQGYFNAGMDYQYDSTKWFLSAEFWMTKVKLMTSAVSQVSNSVRTLFTSQ
ncbi:MAG: hypothetical protein ACWA44_10215 [Thiotrichales bacterium]